MAAKQREGAEKAEPDTLILGAAGQVGSELLSRLPPEKVIPRARETTDIRNLDAVTKLIEAVRPKFVINAAATCPLRVNNFMDHWATNAFAVDHLVKTCALNDVALVHFSTSDVFGATPGSDPRVEMDPVAPLNTFAASKAAGEHAMLAMGQYSCSDFVNFKYWIIRSSMLYARPGRFHHNLLHLKLEQAMRTRSPVLLPNDIFRSPTYVPDLVDQVVWLLDNHRQVPPGIYHIANKGQASLFELVSKVRTQVDSKAMMQLGSCSRSQFVANGELLRADDFPTNGVLDVSRWDELSPIPLRPWQEALADFGREYIAGREGSS